MSKLTKPYFRLLNKIFFVGFEGGPGVLDATYDGSSQFNPFGGIGGSSALYNAPQTSSYNAPQTSYNAPQTSYNAPQTAYNAPSTAYNSNFLYGNRVDLIRPSNTNQVEVINVYCVAS